ncbi:phosphoadenosine phosphosulfate reductase [Sulfitobacter sabulilitoris]|uniref:Phosphoadenosine phosphosulfate reductase n=1 Tax=Sulfitobacter sabulilitoris TaxID=2562655 RepID=A0A5S3PKW6_9RHOB|nr:phosphoadenosine phosphosulfate reductase [Sulfitobacter sabulilitoris]TMM54896.1 phosphoadenosine phosphosulfate reductase [Sulfitobacter sabulilitoris]
MQDTTEDLDISLADLSKDDWQRAIARVADDLGAFQPLGDAHFATFIDDDTTLLVTFETVQGIRSLSKMAQPFGWDLVKANGWSHLCVISDGDTWFRDPAVVGYFDRLVDDGFFDEFERVVFYGAGPCGYAAAAFSVAAPGATVVAIQPQATLDPCIAEWDDRFIGMRRTDFTSRYGYAPDMLDAADDAFVLYDPSQTLDAMHAALFTRPNVTKLRLRHLGGTIQTDLMDMDILFDLISEAGDGTLDAQGFARLYRARRTYPPYLRSVMAVLDRQGRAALLEALCVNVTTRMNAPRFARRLKSLLAAKS